MNRRNVEGDFERWLDRELPGAISAELGRATRPPPRVASRRSPVRRAIAGVGVRGAAAFLAFALAVAGGGAALATGSPNPVSWGQHMVRAVSAGSLTAPHVPVPAPDAAPAPPAAGPSMPASHEQSTPGAGSGDQSNGDGGKSKAKGHGDGGASTDQNQVQDGPARPRDDHEAPNQNQ